MATDTATETIFAEGTLPKEEKSNALDKVMDKAGMLDVEDNGDVTNAAFVKLALTGAAIGVVGGLILGAVT